MAKVPTPKEIRDRFTSYSSEWRQTIEEGRIDMRYVNNDPWTANDRRAREKSGRPCISLDQINQYLNQCENNVRQTEIAVQILPVGDGANDKTATYRENIIRGIDYRSNGQAVDITAFQGAMQRGYGFSKIITQPVDAESFDLELRLKRIPNPDCVLLDPDYKEADASDIQHGFITDLWRKNIFKERFPKAKPVSFSRDIGEEASLWIRENYVQVAEYWQIYKTPRTLLLVDTAQGPQAIYEDEIKEYLATIGERSGRTSGGKFVKLRDQVKVIRERETEHIEVTQYLTNGIEILDEVPWPGTRIPILSCFGRELYVDDGGGAKRILVSLVRLARDPQMLLAYLASLECEEAGMVPKAPFIGYKGQFESDQEAWEYLTKIPKAYVQADLVVDGAGAPLPLPTRPQYVPNFQAYELAKDAAGRALQASMGISPLPTPVQRDNQKSGLALERIETSEAIGTFHLTDNYKRYLHNKGWQLNELIPIVYDTARDVPVGLANGKNTVMRINDDQYAVQFPDKDHYQTGEGDFDVTVSTGPSYQSQREQQSSFVDLAIQNAQAWGIPQPILMKFLALGIRMKDLGDTGEEMAELLDPPDPNNLSAQAQAMVQQLQAQMADLQTENAALHQDRAARVLEQQTKIQIETMKQQGAGAADAAQHQNDVSLAQLANDVKVLIAEIQTKAQSDAERVQMYKEFWIENHTAAHEVGMQAADHEQAQTLADKAAANASLGQASDQAHQQTMADQAQQNQVQSNQ